jgi:uncharacterized membrane protein
MVRGLYVVDIPLEGGNAFNHSNTNLIILIIILFGIFLNGLALSFIALFCRSMIGTCSLAAVVFSITRVMPSQRHSHSRSMNAV